MDYRLKGFACLKCKKLTYWVNKGFARSAVWSDCFQMKLSGPMSGENSWTRIKSVELYNKIECRKLHWSQLFSVRIWHILNLIRDHQLEAFPEQARVQSSRDGRDQFKKFKIVATKSCNQCNFRNLILLPRKKFGRFSHFKTTFLDHLWSK